jgi:hypothetical protein
VTRESPSRSHRNIGAVASIKRMTPPSCFVRGRVPDSKWADISKPGTTPAKVFKDPAAEYGKSYCGRGYIVQLNKVGGTKYFESIVAVGADIVRLSAIGDTGELVQHVQASFCGLVLGTSTYSNTGGGTTHAVDLVGMFDLPTNSSH